MIILDKNFRIEPDTYCWQLVKEEEKEEISEVTGKPIVSKDKWFCTTIEDCLRRYKNETLKTSNSIEDLIIKLNEIELLIKNLKIK